VSSRTLPMNSSPGTEPPDLASELDWLLETSSLIAQPKDRPQAHEGSKGLGRTMTASIDHLDCALGALLIPQRHIRLVQVANPVNTPWVEDAFHSIEAACLKSIQRTKQPMLRNHLPKRALSHPGLRLLAAPVVGRDDIATPGALFFLRSTDDPEFTPLHLSLAKHLCRHFDSVLHADLDPATGLYTRLGLQQYVETANSFASADTGSHAVVCIDIDRLHVVNKVGGYAAGDALVARVAQLLRQPLLPAGAAAARISGNEFAILLPNAGTAVAEVLARSIQGLAVRLASELGQQQPVSLRCGIACFSAPTEFERGLVQAELACETAKDRGRDRLEVYQDDDASMVRRHTDIVALQQLREAMQEDRLTLFAQRIMPLHRRQDVGGYELLLRLVDRPEENRAPGSLLAVALRTELAAELDLWVIEHAIAEARPYLPQLLAANVTLSINLAGPSLTDDRFLERVHALICQAGLPAGFVMFEVTETVALTSLTKAVKFIEDLRAVGCRFALDDFGTGVNSLKNLTSLPIDRVKIDGSFVSNILTNPQSAAIVRAIVTLARDLGIDTVAEYAETEEIIQRLRDLGVEYAQGYGIEKPRAAARVFAEFGTRPCEQHFKLAANQPLAR
jgi:diguanylate cyclase (GGDEF)-like protein